jgi:uncharacterized tellurite resistance protein B-like protein
MNSSLRLKALVQLALVDQSFDDIEKNFIHNIGQANGIPREEVDAIIHKELSNKEFESIDFVGLSKNQKIDYLVSIVELMKVDGKIFLSEINYCKDIAEKLGFKRNVINKITSKIHSEPSLNLEWDTLHKIIEESLKQEEV